MGGSLKHAVGEAGTLPLTSSQRSFLDPAWIPVLGGGCCNISIAVAFDRLIDWKTIQQSIDVLAAGESRPPRRRRPRRSSFGPRLAGCPRTGCS